LTRLATLQQLHLQNTLSCQGDLSQTAMISWYVCCLFLSIADINLYIQIHNPQFDNDFEKTNLKLTNIFDDLISNVGSASGSGASSALDELTLYLNSSVDHLRSDSSREPGNPIKWWRDHRDTYPRLSAMASDYLSIPCKSLIICHLWIV